MSEEIADKEYLPVSPSDSDKPSKENQQNADTGSQADIQGTRESGDISTTKSQSKSMQAVSENDNLATDFKQNDSEATDLKQESVTESVDKTESLVEESESEDLNKSDKIETKLPSILKQSELDEVLEDESEKPPLDEHSSEDSSEESGESTESVANVAEDFGPFKRKVPKKKLPVKKKEVTYEAVGTDEAVKEEEEYVWVEEEVDEEIEVETDETDVEEVEEEERIEEESEEEEEIEKEVGEESEEMAVEAEEKEYYKEEIEEETEGEADLIEEEIEVEERGIVEEELLELDVGQVAEEISEEDKLEEGIGEEVSDEGGAEEGEEEEELAGEGEVEGEEEGFRKKRKRKFKIIKVYKMVRKKKQDVVKTLQEKAEPRDDKTVETPVLEKIDEEKVEKEELSEAAKKERERLVELVRIAYNELLILKRKNKLLTKNIVDYYRHKKIENIQETEPPSPELLKKYHKRLKILSELKQASSVEMTRMTNEVKEMKNESDVVTAEYTKAKEELLLWETELGKIVIQGQTGKPLDESVVAHLVQRHETILNELSSERLTLVRLQNQLALKEAALKQLIAFEGKLNLIDYEQLRMDNQLFSEKVEERDSELAHLRKKVLEIIHTHAHVLEKSDAITDDIEKFNFENSQRNTEVNELREKVNKLKTNRDKLRAETRSMKCRAGLLVRPKLAIDYEESVRKITDARNQVGRLIKIFNKQKVKIEKLRKNIMDANTFNEYL